MPVVRPTTTLQTYHFLHPKHQILGTLGKNTIIQSTLPSHQRLYKSDWLTRTRCLRCCSVLLCCRCLSFSCCKRSLPCATFCLSAATLACAGVSGGLGFIGFMLFSVISVIRITYLRRCSFNKSTPLPHPTHSIHLCVVKHHPDSILRFSQLLSDPSVVRKNHRVCSLQCVNAYPYQVLVHLPNPARSFVDAVSIAASNSPAITAALITSSVATKSFSAPTSTAYLPLASSSTRTP